MINETVFIVGAGTFIVLALYHLVGLSLAREIKFFLPIKVAFGLSLVTIIIGLQQLMLGPEKTIYWAGILALVSMGLLWFTLGLLLPKRASIPDSDVIPQWFPDPNDDRFTHG